MARRFELRGEAAGVTFVDDYAHLPTEVAAALAAAATAAGDRVGAVFQPHRYSRTAALWPDFADAFGDADVLVVTDIYPPGRRPGPASRARSWSTPCSTPTRPGRVAYLPRLRRPRRLPGQRLRPGDLCLTLGAGDLTTLPDEVQAALLARPRP